MGFVQWVDSFFVLVVCLFSFLVVFSLKFVLRNKNIKFSKNMHKNNLSDFGLIVFQKSR